MNRPRITSVASAALASAAAFFVITRSGLAGTLAGAAVASLVYTSTSHWGGQGLERVARWWIARRGGTGAATPVRETEPAPRAGPMAAPGAESIAAPHDEPTAPCDAVPVVNPSLEEVPAHTRRGRVKVGRLARRYGTVVLAVAALAVSGYSLVTGAPLERVIVQERVVEKPVVQERVVVQRETVTVTVPVPGEQQTTTTAAPASSSATTSTVDSSTVPTTTTSTMPPPVTTTTVAPASSTTAAAPPVVH
jgi:hypothetical protein